MNIFFITPKINLEGGGSNTNTDLRIKTLIEKGHKVKVINLFSKYNKLSPESPYEIIPYNKKPKRWFFVNFFVYQILKKYEKETDLFYIDGPQFLWGAGLYKLFGKKPVLLHLNVVPYVILEHGTKLYAGYDSKTSLFKKTKFWIQTKIGRYVDIFFAKKINALTCTSPIIQKQCIDFGFNKDNLHILPEFIDTGLFIQNNKKKPVARVKKHLLYVGRLVPCKGVDLLIKALGNIKQRNITLDIVGDGSELTRLKEISEAIGLDNYVNFHGWVKREDLKVIYDKADIFVHPARWAEPLGITIVEAMSAGLPVIVPKISGSAWVAGRAGLTFQNGDENDLREKISMLLEDNTLYNELQTHTLEEAQKLDYRQWVDEFESLITKLVKINR